MSIATEPSNKNFLSPLGFKFLVKKLPNVNWFVQAVNLPRMMVENTVRATPFVNVPIPGDRVQYGDLEVTFRVDEDMQNYLEIHNWLIATAFPENFDQYKGIDQLTLTNRFNNMDSIRSDASLIVLDSKMQPKVEVSFKDIIPIDITQLSFDTRLLDVTYLDATVTFKYLNYTIKEI